MLGKKFALFSVPLVFSYDCDVNNGHCGDKECVQIKSFTVKCIPRCAINNGGCPVDTDCINETNDSVTCRAKVCPLRVSGTEVTVPKRRRENGYNGDFVAGPTGKGGKTMFYDTDEATGRPNLFIVWTDVKGAMGWVVTPYIGSMWGKYYGMLSRSDVATPDLATDWQYLPHGQNTDLTDYIPFTDDLKIFLNCDETVIESEEQGYIVQDWS